MSQHVLPNEVVVGRCYRVEFDRVESEGAYGEVTGRVVHKSRGVGFGYVDLIFDNGVELGLDRTARCFPIDE